LQEGETAKPLIHCQTSIPPNRIQIPGGKPNPVPPPFRSDIVATVQTPGAPTVRNKLTATNTAMVYWQSPSPGWNLQANSDLSTTNCVTQSEPLTDNGTIKYILVTAPGGNRFFRLRYP
jgi:hypothetical protein